MLICACCERSFEANLMVTCSICSKYYKNNCVDLTANEVKLLNGNKGVEWSCKKCKDSGNSIKDLKVLILQLQNDIQSMKSQMKVGTDLTEDVFEEIVAEINDRNSKKSNIILFGVPEPNQNLPSDTRLESDKASVVDLLNLVLPNESFEHVKPIRLGKYDIHQNRIIKVPLNNEHIVQNVIRNASRLRNSPKYKTISVSFDRTRRQIEHYKKIKSEMLERNKNGDKCKIKYISGVPRIVDLNQ